MIGRNTGAMSEHVGRYTKREKERPNAIFLALYSPANIGGGLLVPLISMVRNTPLL